MMKKWLKFIVVISILFAYIGLPISALAMDITNIISTTKDEENKKEVLENASTGKLSIEILLDFATNKKSFTVTLANVKNTIQPTELTTKENAIYIHFNKIPNGEYVLTVKGDGYATYQRSISIQNDVSSITMTNKATKNDSILSENKYALLSIGDSNGDGIITDKDEEAILQKINSNVYDTKMDFNGDGLLNISDLSYITYNKNQSEIGTITKSVLLEDMKTLPSETTQITKGTLENILEKNGQEVCLAPNNGVEISQTNPVQIQLIAETPKTAEGIIITPSSNKDNRMEQGEFTIQYEDSSSEVVTIGMQIPHLLTTATTSVGATVNREQDGTIAIQLNNQKPIKQITIKITKTSGNKLVDIAQVEFLKDMESRIPAPTMDIPKNLVATPDSEEFTVSWNKEINVTGYEVQITAEGQTQTLKTSVNSITVKQFQNAKVKNYTEYSVKVQSVNGDWSSGYSSAISVIPMPKSVPDAPDNVSVKGGYRLLEVSWKNMKSTKNYTVYYKEEGSSVYENISKITGTNVKITGLKDKTTYYVYVTGTNEIGTSKPSLEQVATTTDVNPPVTSNYKLINTPIEGEDKTNHITSISYSAGNKPNINAIADNDYTTAWILNSWDAGGFNTGKPSPIIEFDIAYKMDRLIVIPAESQPTKYDYFYAKTQYWDENNNSHMIEGHFTKKTSSNNKIYYEFEYDEPIIVKKIQINFALYLAYGDGSISIAEMKFYHYDSLEDDIYQLYSDQMHVTLREDVTQSTIEELQSRLDTVDEVSRQYHPKRELLQKELDTAREILQDKQIKSAICIDTTVSKSYDSAITFKGGLTAMQPLGAVAYAGQTVNVYVGNPNKKTGDSTELNLIATQYHAEASSWIKTVTKLKIGKNEITIPELQSIVSEHGGALYVEYTGKDTKATYGIRVSGASEVPVLDISKVEIEEEKKSIIAAYVSKLEAYVPTLESLHAEHKGEGKVGNYEYDFRNCILGATDIVLDNMMYSVFSKQILEALKGTHEEKTEQLYQSLKAMEDMIELFYEHKGLSTKEEAGAKNQYPTSRLNIRYQRMFAGAFMYAGGLHIGIEWDSIPGLAKSKPVQASEQGLYTSGNYFGWGIAHEIGHIINEGSYAIAEITNNYFSVLAQAKDTNDSVRFQYEDVYKKVTSNTEGRDSNVFTQLGMYWQLHLAYDKAGYNFKIYDTYQEQFDNLVYARMDTFARDISKAPAPNGVKLTLKGDAENNFMRLAAAATGRNLKSFYTRWGLIPDETTKQYIEQFPEETVAIYYINDDARKYQLDGKQRMNEATEVKASMHNEKNSNMVTITLSNTEINQEAILGYEIVRVEQRKDKTIRKTVGFVQANQTEFKDYIETVNNRTFSYEITAFDKYLNPTPTLSLEEIKISHDGSLEKTDWKVSTNMTSMQDEEIAAGDTEPCEPKKSSAIYQVMDKEENTTYIGKVANANPQVVITLPELTSVAGLRYTIKEGIAITDYEIYISTNSKEWQKVQEGKFAIQDGETTIYFNKENDPQMYIYDAKYVKLVAKNQKNKEIAITELDILGPTGDNIELLSVEAETTPAIGILKETYETNGVTIPKGSLVFTGSYKGNPAYNAVLLWNEKGELVGNADAEGNILAKQLILADLPEKGELGETSNGTWIYWIEPNTLGDMMSIPTTVRAELYRVDNAITMEGERLVSNTLTITLPKELPEIILEK